MAGIVGAFSQSALLALKLTFKGLKSHTVPESSSGSLIFSYAVFFIGFFALVPGVAGTIVRQNLLTLEGIGWDFFFIRDITPIFTWPVLFMLLQSVSAIFLSKSLKFRENLSSQLALMNWLLIFSITVQVLILLAATRTFNPPFSVSDLSTAYRYYYLFLGAHLGVIAFTLVRYYQLLRWTIPAASSANLFCFASFLIFVVLSAIYSVVISETG